MHKYTFWPLWLIWNGSRMVCHEVMAPGGRKIYTFFIVDLYVVCHFAHMNTTFYWRQSRHTPPPPEFSGAAPGSVEVYITFIQIRGNSSEGFTVLRWEMIARRSFINFCHSTTIWDLTCCPAVTSQLITNGLTHRSLLYEFLSCYEPMWTQYPKEILLKTDKYSIFREIITFLS